MKQIFLLLFCSLLTFGVSAQSNSLTAGIGLLNPKLRVQFEHGLNSNTSTGANLTYYMVNWKGPRLEGFYRIYFSNDNENGLFAQGKAGVGLFTNVFDDGDDLTFVYYDDNFNELSGDIYESNNWMTFGAGVAVGYKFTSNGGFVFESTLGYQFWSGPPDNYTLEYLMYYDDYYSLGETIGYYLVGPGFPLDLQFKFGFNF